MFGRPVQSRLSAETNKKKKQKKGKKKKKKSTELIGLSAAFLSFFFSLRARFFVVEILGSVGFFPDRIDFHLMRYLSRIALERADEPQMNSFLLVDIVFNSKRTHPISREKVPSFLLFGASSDRIL